MTGFCEECGRPAECVHHMIYGKNRANSEKYKKQCTCKLCNACHRRLHDSDEQLAMKYRIIAQERFETVFGHDEYMRVFGRNYL